MAGLAGRCEVRVLSRDLSLCGGGCLAGLADRCEVRVSACRLALLPVLRPVLCLSCPSELGLEKPWSRLLSRSRSRSSRPWVCLLVREGLLTRSPVCLLVCGGLLTRSPACLLVCEGLLTRSSERSRPRP